MATNLLTLFVIFKDGAGDTQCSFAFDGSRVQKWNMKMHSKYGEVDFQFANVIFNVM